MSEEGTEVVVDWRSQVGSSDQAGRWMIDRS